MAVTYPFGKLRFPTAPPGSGPTNKRKNLDRGGGGVPLTMNVDGVTYMRLVSPTTGQILYSRSGQPLYGRVS
jgi:hypothetical protein